jgi:hypothetical protein
MSGDDITLDDPDAYLANNPIVRFSVTLSAFMTTEQRRVMAQYFAAWKDEPDA